MKAVVAIACLALLLPESGAQSIKRKAASAAKKSSEAVPASSETPAGTPKAKAGATAPKTPSAKTKNATEKKSAGATKPAKTVPPRSASTAASPKKAPSKPKLDKPPQDNAGEEPTRHSRVVGPNITLDPEDLADFEKNPEPVQRLLMLGLELTRQGLTYRYGSSDPSTGGMDCSGTIYYLLKAAGIKEPPRDSSGMYLWAQREGTLRRVDPASLEDSALADLRPGDLLFWEGTYEVQRDPPISHTMIYLGREKTTGLPVMVGASDGRTYAGTRRNGVSVFDFKLPRADSAAKFVGYACVPGLEATPGTP